MMGNRALLTNFMENFLGTVRFGNNDLAVIAGYKDVVIESMMIKKVYYVKDLGHNLFSVEQFYLLTGDCSSNLYTIALNEIASNSSNCLLAKASSSQSWLWHQRLSHLNFTTINNLVKKKLVQGLPKMKFKKDHLCSACEQGKIHRKHHKSKTAFASNKLLYLPRMDLCGSMRVESINRNRYVLVVVDDFSCCSNRGYTLIPARKDFTVFQMEVKMAFLNEIIKEEVYVAQPPGFVSKQYPDHVDALDKALYDLKQAPRAWYDVLSTFLIDSGFQKDVAASNPTAEMDYNSALQRPRELRLPIHRSEDQMVFTLIDVWVRLVEPLSIENLMGEACTSGNVPTVIATTTVLSNTFASTSSIPLIIVYDNEIVGANGHENV
uniref:Retrovirus-related Pol polyprotein from transposon TNT 1-94 n=1 Tax=Tanacetum cinerariifolium TaxID=118510 RepID=A0A6L2LQR3_TANCI|nr:hypothetical protein [Tanacetum cinerariifolium]